MLRTSQNEFRIAQDCTIEGVSFFTINTFMVDPGFPRGGANSRRGCANLLFCKFFAKIYRKMKDFGPRGGASLTPLGSATVDVHQNIASVSFWRKNFRHKSCLVSTTVLRATYLMQWRI